MDWRGPIAFILALGVATALVSGVLSAEITPGKVTSQEVSFFSTLGGAIVGAVATYLGVQHRPKGREDMQETETTDTTPAEPEPAPAQPRQPEQPAPAQPEQQPEQPDEDGDDGDE
jgi:hypothetical protein